MKYSTALAAVLIALMGPASATEYLANGGFESGDFSGWDLEDSPAADDAVVATDNGFLGLNYGAEKGEPKRPALSLRRSLTLRASS